MILALYTIATPVKFKYKVSLYLFIYLYCYMFIKLCVCECQWLSMKTAIFLRLMSDLLLRGHGHQLMYLSTCWHLSLLDDLPYKNLMPKEWSHGDNAVKNVLKKLANYQHSINIPRAPFLTSEDVEVTCLHVWVTGAERPAQEHHHDPDSAQEDKHNASRIRE